MTDRPQPTGLRPHRIARTDQQMAVAAARLDRLLAEYRAAAAESGDTEAVLAVSLAMRVQLSHIDAAMIATAAIQRLAEQGGPGHTTAPPPRP